MRHTRFTLRCALSLLAATSPLILSACAPMGQMLTQDKALQDCRKQPRIEDQIACRKQTQDTYRDYDHQREALTVDTPRSTEPPRKKSLCFQRAGTGETVCPN